MKNGFMPASSSKAPGHLLTLNWPVHVPGGVNETVLGLAQQLQARGFPATVAIAKWSKEPQPAETRGVEVISLRLREPLSQGAGPRLLPGFLLTLASDSRALLSLLRDKNIQVVNANFPTLNVAVIPILKALGLYRGKFLLTFHGADIAEVSGSSGLVRRVWRALITRADGVVACSDALRREVLQFAPQARVTAIHNGADIALFNGIIRPSQPSIRRILHIGKFEHKKSQDVILHAFKRLLESHPDCSLVLIGADGPLLRQTRALIQELGLEKQVELHVNVPHDQLPRFMEKAELFILPSRVEPFGIVLLEAGAAGLPVVATQVGGIPELIEHERTGLLISPDSVEELALAMRRLIENPDLAGELGRKWHERVIATWSWDITCQKYLQMIDRI
jgi:glycosyltransferase involved in cell wall biosynthesis